MSEAPKMTSEQERINFVLAYPQSAIDEIDRLRAEVEQLKQDVESDQKTICDVFMALEEAKWPDHGESQNGGLTVPWLGPKQRIANLAGERDVAIHRAERAEQETADWKRAWENCDSARMHHFNRAEAAVQERDRRLRSEVIYQKLALDLYEAVDDQEYIEAQQQYRDYTECGIEPRGADIDYTTQEILKQPIQDTDALKKAIQELDRLRKALQRVVDHCDGYREHFDDYEYSVHFPKRLEDYLRTVLKTANVTGESHSGATESTKERKGCSQ